MSIFGNIMSAIFKSASPAGTAPSAAAPRPRRLARVPRLRRKWTSQPS